MDNDSQGSPGIRAGRPPKGRAKRETRIVIRVSDDEREQIEQAAVASRLDTSTFARRLLLDAAERISAGARPD